MTALSLCVCVCSNKGTQITEHRATPDIPEIAANRATLFCLEWMVINKNVKSYAAMLQKQSRLMCWLLVYVVVHSIERQGLECGGAQHWKTRPWMWWCTALKDKALNVVVHSIERQGLECGRAQHWKTRPWMWSCTALKDKALNVVVHSIERQGLECGSAQHWKTHF